jgi:uncharacterized protein YkwD
MRSIGAPNGARALLVAGAGAALLASCGTGGATVQGLAATVPTTTSAAAAAEAAAPVAAPTVGRTTRTSSHAALPRRPSTQRSTPRPVPVPATPVAPAPRRTTATTPTTSRTTPAPKRTTSPPTTQPKPPGTGLAPDESQVLTLVNQQRKAAGCAALTVDPILVAVARAHSTDMAVRGYFDHTSPDGKSPFDRMREAGYKGGLMGENIAAGQPTPAAVMTAWMNSPGHRANILNCGYKVIGIGVHTLASSPYRIYWTQDFGDR